MTDQKLQLLVEADGDPISMTMRFAEAGETIATAEGHPDIVSESARAALDELISRARFRDPR